MNSFSVSVVIPVWYEAKGINERIVHVYQRAAEAMCSPSVQVIVADGDPEASTLAAIENEEVIQVKSPQGRAMQMNAGAAMATGDVLLFLHADTVLPVGAFDLIQDALRKDRASGVSAKAGAFSLSIASDSRFLYLVSKLSNWRNRITRTPYGDQAQFFVRSYFEEISGYAPIPLMEDVEIMRRIRDRNDPLAIIDTPISTSARRWEAEGMYRCTLRNVLLRLLYGAGVSAQTLSNWYRAMKG
ncbi:TIGR04283 family arsenosugar biosynthesis glycosyltransferase [Halodesulfovibrio marinisediminis]|uniref:Transferase 2, rSAM/selenodomain-associated n=1 Tax=Halodesulfovibrio marinisediminis DSM 17456 TaxID=1121457 RepID=A0A1N6ISH2_9BACT|nr:TIGR04283 family arsenosugar biosynthesis glycosyltransferase [Halodesulfovibrio marinisediminis]SIO34948.1 transferase 2, rSAM/selenodomain-associated [Halodesulfovibrio marinisediminis DSM 17456]